MTDLEKLEALAREAAPGPWSVGGSFKTNEYVSGRDNLAPAIALCYGPAVNSMTPPDIAPRNAAYIAAANPTAILALIAHLREVEADAEMFRWLVENRITHAHFVHGLDFIYHQQDIRAAIDAAMGDKS